VKRNIESWKNIVTWTLIRGNYGIATGFAAWLNRPGKPKQRTDTSQVAETLTD